jgi:hypothetical protein
MIVTQHVVQTKFTRHSRSDVGNNRLKHIRAFARPAFLKQRLVPRKMPKQLEREITLAAQLCGPRTRSL